MNLKITGAKGTTDVTALVPSVKWSGDHQQAARALHFSMVSSTSDKGVPVVDCPLGAAVKMTEAGKILFDGYVFSRTKDTDASKIELGCYDRGFYLKRNRASYKFMGVTPEAVAARIAADFGIQVGALAATGVPISRLFLTGRDTLYEILSTVYTLASRVTGEKYHIGFDGAALCVRVRKPGAKTLILRGKSNLIGAAVSESVEKMVNTVAIYDAAGNQVRRLEDAEAVKLYGRMQETVKQTTKDDKAGAAQNLLDGGGVSQQITVDCLGDVRCVTGGCVVVQEPYTGLHGLFYIDSDTHEWKRGQYYNKLVLNFKNMMSEKDAGNLPGT